MKNIVRNLTSLILSAALSICAYGQAVDHSITRVKDKLYEGAQKSPNILFINIDDLRPQLGCYGEKQMHTPNIDALASEGVLFEKAYCQSPLCGPSRASFMTGQYPQSIQVYNNKVHFRDKKPDIVTMPQFFKNKGYNAFGFGKIYHPPMHDDASWTEPIQQEIDGVSLYDANSFDYTITKNKI